MLLCCLVDTPTCYTIPTSFCLFIYVFHSCCVRPVCILLCTRTHALAQASKRRKYTQRKKEHTNYFELNLIVVEHATHRKPIFIVKFFSLVAAIFSFFALHSSTHHHNIRKKIVELLFCRRHHYFHYKYAVLYVSTRYIPI